MGFSKQPFCKGRALGAAGEILWVCFWLTVVGGNMQLALVSDLCLEQTPAFPRVPSCPSFITAPSPGKKPGRRL